MQKPVIIVTGANGQLGREIRDLAALYPSNKFVFLAKEDLPIHSFEKVKSYFEEVMPQYCINCAAYTAVDKAETNQELAMEVNGMAVGVLAEVCRSLHTQLIHISTDYVFDGTASEPYKEDFLTSPVNYYGATKLKGEALAMENNPGSLVIRTSWVYSTHGNNFVKTMIRLIKEKESLNVVNDQFGSPTYAADLAKIILDIVDATASGQLKWMPGIYHYSNDGIISWYDFAVAIKTLTGSSCSVYPVSTASYPTPAKRPAYSAFDKDKIKSAFRVPDKNWLDRLTEMIGRLGQ